MNILFVCKHNVFRSKIAEAYFKKVNKNKNINVSSAGIIKSDILTKTEKRIVKFQRETAREFGIEVKDGSKSMSISLLNKQDIIIIVANDVPKKIFNNKFYLKQNLKVVVWKIFDVKKEEDYKEVVKKSIKVIMKKIDKLVEELKWKLIL